jgi:hypothetical protein
MSKCRLSGKETKCVFDLGELHMSDFIAEDEEARFGKGSLKMMLCEESGLLQLDEPIPLDKMYGKYWYRSGINSTMRRKLKDVVDVCLESVPTKPGDVFLDIACNDGTMFEFIPEHLIKVGIDPADESFTKEAAKRADVAVRDFFSADVYKKTAYGNNKPKIITTIAMFYDLDDPLTFVNDVKEILDDDGIWVLQLSYTPLMLKQLAFDNICHEHICYYSLSSLKYLFEQAGLDIVDCTLNEVNGGSFRIFAMKKESDKSNFRCKQERDVADFRVASLLEYEKSLNLDKPETYERFYEEICELKKHTVNFIKQEKLKGKKIWGYGASTKGNTLLQWYGLDNTYIDAIAEKSPYKFDLKTAGTDIPIKSEAEMREANPDYLLILPWHFIKEFAKREKDFVHAGGKLIVPCPQFLVYPDEEI